MKVRLAGPSDLGALLMLVREYCIEDRHDFDEPQVRKALMPLLENDQLGVVWVIGMPAEGYAVVTWGYSLESGGRDALLDEVYVRERGRGSGATLLKAAITDATARGMKRMFLETESPNQAARRFYARHGFEAEDSIWMSLRLYTGEAAVVASEK